VSREGLEHFGEEGVTLQLTMGHDLDEHLPGAKA
jgi:hypothetical protein